MERERKQQNEIKRLGHRIIKVSSFPVLAQRYPEAETDYAAAEMYRQITPAKPFDSIIEQSPTPANLMMYVERFTAIPSEKIVPITGATINLSKKSGDYPAQFTELGVNNSPLIEAGVTKISNNLENLKRAGEFIALHLIKGDLINSDGDAYSGIAELRRDINRLGIHEIGVPLEQMLNKWSTSGEFEELVEQGLFNPEDSELFFANLAKWNAQVSLDISFRRNYIISYFPSSPAINYDIRYLPHLVNGVNDYLNALPEFLEPGKVFPLGGIVDGLVQLRAICEDVLKANAKTQDHESLKNILRRVNTGLSEVSDTYTELLATGAWNKRREDLASFTEVPTFSQIRELIRRSGGRAPRNLDIRRRFAIRRGADI